MKKLLLSFLVGLTFLGLSTANASDLKTACNLLISGDPAAIESGACKVSYSTGDKELIVKKIRLKESILEETKKTIPNALPYPDGNQRELIIQKLTLETEIQALYSHLSDVNLGRFKPTNSTPTVTPPAVNVEPKTASPILNQIISPEYQALNDEIAADIQALGALKASGTASAEEIKGLEETIEAKRLELAKLAGTGSAAAGASATTGPGGVQVSTTNSGAKYAAQYKGPVFDGPGLRGGANQVAGQLDNSVSKERNLKRLIIDWTNFLLSIASIMAVVALVWAGFLYITAFGDDSRMETAKKIVIWVILGILLILAAYAIVNTVMRAVF